MHIDKTQQNMQIIKQVFLNKNSTKLPKKEQQYPPMVQFHQDQFKS